MQRHFFTTALAAVCLAVAAGVAAQDRPATPQPATSPTPATPPSAGPFIGVPQPGVAPGLPTVELAPVLQRVARAANKRFLVDGRVGPQIYLAGTEPNDVTYPVLLSILRANGLAAVEIEGRVNIVPVNDIRTYPLPTVQTDDASIAADEWVTRVVTTTNIEAAQLVPILRPLLPPWAHLAALPSSQLVIIDRYANVKRITDLVRSLDTPRRN